jgi:hypothetical protein
VSLSQQHTQVLLFCQAAFSAEPLTKEQAIDIATKFITSVGWPMPDADKLTCKMEEDGRSGRKDGKLWQVTGGRRTFEIGIDPQTGYVCFVTDDAWQYTRKALTPDQIPVKLTAEMAEAKARAYLSTAGIPTDNLKVMSNKLINTWADVRYQDWWVTFSQMYHGYPLPYGALVNMDDTDGSFLGLGAPLSPITPDDCTVKLSQADAENKAHDYFSSAGKQLGSRIHAELRYVQPNDRWENLGIPAQPLGGKVTVDRLRLAWQLIYDAPWDVTEIWVDSENGEILGGDFSLTIEKKPAKTP